MFLQVRGGGGHKPRPLRLPSVVAKAEEADAGRRLLDGDGDEVGGDVCDEDVLDQTPHGLPVLVLDRDRGVLVLVGLGAALVFAGAQLVLLLAVFGSRSVLLDLRRFLDAALVQPGLDFGALDLGVLWDLVLKVLPGLQPSRRAVLPGRRHQGLLCCSIPNRAGAVSSSIPDQFTLEVERLKTRTRGGSGR